MSEGIRVVIADDHPVVRRGLATFLGLQGDIALVGEAADGEEAVAQVERLLPDVVLLDLKMPKLDGIEVTRHIVAVSPSTKVIILSSFGEDDMIFAAIRAGAAGYLLKDAEPEAVVDGIRRVRRGEGLLDPAIAGRVMADIAGGGRSEPHGDLTERELEVLRLIATGLTNREIAERLVVSEKTVKTHVSNVLAKLHLADRTKAALYAVREHLVELE